MHCPINGCVFCSDFLNKVPILVIAKKPKTSRLTFDAPLFVFVATIWPTMYSRLLGANKELGRTIADTGDADGRMYFDRLDQLYVHKKSFVAQEPPQGVSRIHLATEGTRSWSTRKSR